MYKCTDLLEMFGLVKMIWYQHLTPSLATSIESEEKIGLSLSNYAKLFVLQYCVEILGFNEYKCHIVQIPLQITKQDTVEMQAPLGCL